MSAPNIVHVATINGTTVSVAIADNTPTVIVNNPADSGKVQKVNSLTVANKAADPLAITLEIFSEDDGGGSGIALAKAIVLPENASLILIDKNTSVYLVEDKSLVLTCEGNDAVDVVASYEEISE